MIAASGPRVAVIGAGMSGLLSGVEIQAYFEKTALDFNLESFIQYDINRCEFRGHWELEAADGHRDTADFVICATGVADAMGGTVWVTGCRSWYLCDNGIPATWPWTFDRFQQAMRQPDLDHFERVA